MVCVNPVNAVDSYVLNKGDDDFSSPSTLVININNFEEEDAQGDSTRYNWVDQENGNKDRRIHIVSINTTDKPTSRRPMPPQAAAAFKRFQDFK